MCNWTGKLSSDRGRLDIAVKELSQYARRLILITEPPELPKAGTRESIRNSSRPPFTEDPTERAIRMEMNAYVKSLASGTILVLDVESLFTERDGSLRFSSSDGRLLYQDGDHLSDTGAELVKADLVEATEDLKKGE